MSDAFLNFGNLSLEDNILKFDFLCWFVYQSVLCYWYVLSVLYIFANVTCNFGHSFAFDVPTLWNDLPDDVRSAPTLPVPGKT